MTRRTPLKHARGCSGYSASGLGPQNLGRHRLGFAHLFKSKAKRLEAEMQFNAPGVNVAGIDDDAKQVELGRLDLLIDATGEQSLSDWISWKYSGTVPLLTAWVEGPGNAVRALFKRTPEHACSRCVSRPPRSEELRVFEKPQPQLLRGHGCEDLYVPFPASASIQAAALAMEMVQTWLNDANGPTFRTRVLNTSIEQRTGDCSPLKNEGMRPVKAS